MEKGRVVAAGRNPLDRRHARPCRTMRQNLYAQDRVENPDEELGKEEVLQKDHESAQLPPLSPPCLGGRARIRSSRALRRSFALATSTQRWSARCFGTNGREHPTPPASSPSGRQPSQSKPGPVETTSALSPLREPTGFRAAAGGKRIGGPDGGRQSKQKISSPPRPFRRLAFGNPSDPDSPLRTTLSDEIVSHSQSRDGGRLLVGGRGRGRDRVLY